MTREQFNEYNRTKTMPREWIGQGWGYKLVLNWWEKWEELADSEIIYIPEYGYGDDDTVDPENAFTKEDFINYAIEALPNGDEKEWNERAKDLFDAVDWQFPSTLIEEGWVWEERGEENE